MKISSWLATLTLSAACAAPQATTGSDWSLLLGAEHTEGWTSTSFGGEGEIQAEDGLLVFEMGSPMTGMNWVGEPLPTSGYELEVKASRLMGTDFFCGLSFPVGEEHATLIMGGWGGALTGLSCIDGNDASTNETTSFQSYELGRIYTARIRVTKTHITTWLDGEELHSVSLAGKDISLRPEVFPSKPLGFAAFQTRAGLESLKLRRL